MRGTFSRFRSCLSGDARLELSVAAPLDPEPLSFGAQAHQVGGEITRVQEPDQPGEWGMPHEDQRGRARPEVAQDLFGPRFEQASRRGPEGLTVPAPHRLE
jgi:hypothetical protein